MTIHSYDREHWEVLVETILRRIGVGRFVETIGYVLEQQPDLGAEPAGIALTRAVKYFESVQKSGGEPQKVEG